MKAKLYAYILGSIQLLVGIGAIPAGLSMIKDPSGKKIGMTTKILENSPFEDFFIPGIFLFFFHGLLGIICAIISFKEYKYTVLCGFLLGSFLILWIAIQVYFIGFIHFLQPLFLMLGIVEIVLTYLYKVAYDVSRR